MYKKLLPCLFAAALFLGTAPNTVLAQMPGQQTDPIAMYAEAGASPEQQSKIRGLAHEFEASAKVKQERAKNLMRKMQQFSLEPMPDEKTVVDTQTEINSILNDMAMARIKLMMQIRNLLTAEQRTKLVQMLKDNKPPQPGM